MEIEFEELLLNSRNGIVRTNNIFKKTNEEDYNIYKGKKLDRAEKSATINDFITMVTKLVHLVMEEEYNVIFMPDENGHAIISPSVKIDKNYITYTLNSRKPIREIKPMPREEIREHSNIREEDRLGLIYGQKFECIIQFNVFSSNYEMANKIIDAFEDLIFTYTGYMKSNGVGNILLIEQLTDKDFDIFRKSLSVRNLKYNVEIEKLIVIFNEKIKGIIAEAEVIQ